jgi:hypothetical protein
MGYITYPTSINRETRLVEGVVSNIWRANTGQYFVIAVSLFDEWVNSVMRRTSVSSRALVRNTMADMIVECIAELETIEESKLKARAIQAICENKGAFYEFA